MKANELMIGDWLRTSRGIAKVIAVDKIGLTFKIDGGDFDIDWDDEEEWFDAIPLTPEILEKNGMILSFYGEFFPEDEHYELEISVVGGRIFWTINAHEYDIMCLRFVHELQHALRLCGIEKEITI